MKCFFVHLKQFTMIDTNSSLHKQVSWENKNNLQHTMQQSLLLNVLLSVISLHRHDPTIVKFVSIPCGLLQIGTEVSHSNKGFFNS